MRAWLEILLGLPAGAWSDADEWGLSLGGLPANTWAVLGLAVLLAGLVWLTVRSYRREGDAPRGAKAALATLRIAALVVLVALLLEPTLTLRRIEPDRATVVVLLDESLSMGLADAYEPAERQALAEAAGVPVEQVDAAERVALVRALLARADGPLAALAGEHRLRLMAFSTDRPGEQGYTRTLAVVEPPAARAAAGLPAAAAVAVANVVALAAGLWLAVLAVRLVVTLRRARALPPGASARGPGVLVWATAPLAVAVLLGAGLYALRAGERREAGVEALRAALAAGEPLSAEQLATARTDAELSALLDAHGLQRRAVPGLAEQLAAAADTLGAEGFQTDLARAVREALEGAGRIEAIVVLSDGQPTGGAGGEARLGGARQLARQRGVDLYALAVGSEIAPPNVRVASVAMPAQTRRGATLPAVVSLEATAADARPVTVRLMRQGPGQDDWQDTGATGEVSFEPPGEADPVARAQLTLNVQADEVGEFVYRAVAEPARDERLTGDNEALARVSVSAEPVRVLLVSGDAGWEFQYLRNLLLRSPEQYRVSVWQQNAETDFNQQASTGMQLARLPRSRDELIDRYDVVLLYDPAYTQGGFDGPFVDLLAEFVSRHRGGLGYLASRKYTGELLAVEGGPFDPLRHLLPVTVGREGLGLAERMARPEPVGWPVRLTAVGADHPVMHLAPAEELSRQLWAALPGLYWAHPVSALKPTAVALAVHADPAERTAEGEPLPLVALQMYGRGPVLYFGSDETWRWRYLEAARHYERFWANAIDFLASYRQMKRRVLLATGSADAALGERLGVTAEVYDEAFEPLEAPDYTVRLIDAETGAATPIRLQPDGRTPGLYRGSVRLEKAGDFELKGPAGVADEDVAGRFITVSRPREEFARPQANPAALAALAGPENQLRLADADTLPGRIPPSARAVVRQRSADLWTRWPALAVLALLLCTEWALRKRYNMT